MRRSLIALLLVLASLPLAAADLPSRTTSSGGVLLKVTPQTLSAGSWDFYLLFETHVQEINDDLARNSVLIADGAAPVAPLEWKGDPPGGHHRRGVLRFKPPSPAPRSIELRIQRPGEPAPRSYRWQLR